MLSLTAKLFVSLRSLPLQASKLLVSYVITHSKAVRQLTKFTLASK